MSIKTIRPMSTFRKVVITLAMLTPVIWIAYRLFQPAPQPVTVVVTATSTITVTPSVTPSATANPSTITVYFTAIVPTSTPTRTPTATRTPVATATPTATPENFIQLDARMFEGDGIAIFTGYESTVHFDNETMLEIKVTREGTEEFQCVVPGVPFEVEGTGTITITHMGFLNCIGVEDPLFSS